MINHSRVCGNRSRSARLGSTFTAARFILAAAGCACSADALDPAATSAPTPSQSIVTLQPDGASGQDVWITSIYSYGDDYGVDDEKLQVGGWGDSYYALIRFDVENMPMSATSATVVLQPFARTELAPTDVSTPVPMTLHQITSAWNENTGWFSQPATTFISNLPAPVVGRPYAIDITDIYNKWKSGTAQNLGLELRPTANDNRFDVFRSSDYKADPSVRPMLKIVSASVPSGDHFTWPIDPTNESDGFFAPCSDSPQCFWLNAGGWRDVQPFLRYEFIDNGKVYGYHLGADWDLGSDPADAGLPVASVADGVVVSVQPNVKQWGNVVFIEHQTSFGTYTSMYAHVDWMPSGPPRLGRVARGQQIARIGNGGGLYPYHLHFEIREGRGADVGPGYVPSPTSPPPQGQLDPDAFIATHR